MKQEQPVRVEKRKANKKYRSHATETRIFAREIHETFCDDPACKFYGKHAAQGICHTRGTFYSKTGYDSPDWSYIEMLEKRVAEELAQQKKKHFGKSRKKWIAYLESLHICDQMNTVFGLDELIRLRMENALLRLKAGKST